MIKKITIFICFVIIFQQMMICVGADEKKLVKTDTEVITLKAVPVISENGKVLYYRNNGLYKQNKNGKHKKVTKQIIKEYSDIKCVLGNYIYYANKHDKLCRIRMDGKKERIYKNIKAKNCVLINVYRGYLYYYYDVGNDFCLYRVKSTGIKEKKILDNYYPIGPVFNNNTIYFSRNNIGNNGEMLDTQIYRIDCDGKNEKMIFNYDSVVYILGFKNSKLYITKNDVDNRVISILENDDGAWKENDIYDVNKDCFSEVFYGTILDDSIYFWTENGIVCKHDFGGCESKIINHRKSDPFIIDNVKVNGDYIMLLSDGKWFFYDKYGGYYGFVKTSVKVKGKKCKLMKICIKNNIIRCFYDGKKTSVKKIYALK